MANFLKIANKIKKELDKGVDNYHTGLIGEQIIVASYQTMPLDKLEKMQFIISKLIKKKKEYLRVKNAQSNALPYDSVHHCNNDEKK